MRILLVLDRVENPASANALMGFRLAEQLLRRDHTVHILTLWDGLHTPPAPPEGAMQHLLAFADERQMNEALENGQKGGTPVPLRLARLAAHPAAAAAAFRQLVLKQPRRTVDSRREIERLDAEFHFDAVCAVCAPYRTAFALEAAAIRGKKFLWQLDPYASNRDYTAPGGFAREGQLLDALDGTFVTPQALPDYADGAPLALNADNRTKKKKLDGPIAFFGPESSLPASASRTEFLEKTAAWNKEVGEILDENLARQQKNG